MRTKTYFLSDIHLGNRYLEDPLSVEKRLVAWLESIRRDAAAVYFLGDVFDYWYEYKYVVPRGHVRFLGKIAELADVGVEIHFLIGNHDIWMFDYLEKEIGAIIHRKPFTVTIDGKMFFLAHGDEIGYRPLQYRLIQSIFRNRLCQILYSSIHPRWTFDFARRWSLNSRRKGMNKEKLTSAQQHNARHLKEFALSYSEIHPDVDFFVFGHVHIVENEHLTPSARMLIIGDWLHNFSYAVWNGSKLELNILN
ncbi:MAG: UDP-2,3-diacylglucosamine diphosphatase [Tannerella sp.]|jgi:UDP-2,3-diacylglucosamine hydrolase|nr:UDP-2,3-diacylglucosamine diphosphatase [Tannerella sp.]